MINKENQNKKVEDSKKESRRQTTKETEGERESKGYAKTEKGERQKVEDRESSIEEKKETDKNKV